ncbi:MAG: aminotransferase class IV [Planctomycetaceae bacterium]
MSTPLANWNGDELPLDQVRVSVLDRSFLFGDAVYEMLRVYGGKPFLLREHLGRLKYSLGELRIRADVDRIERRLRQTLEHAGVQEGLAYVHISRGAAPQRTHQFPVPPPAPNELIWVRAVSGDKVAEYRETGVKVITVPDVRWKRCDIKSCNLLGNVLASEAAEIAGCQEAILIGENEIITEGSHSSVFGVDQGQILTAPLAANVLPGITRRLVVKLARRVGLPLREESLHLERVWSLDELFITGTSIDVLPVTLVDGQVVGPGKPGPVTKRLRQAYLDFVADGDF